MNTYTLDMAKCIGLQEDLLKNCNIFLTKCVELQEINFKPAREV
jgi:hypothetical protein